MRFRTFLAAALLILGASFSTAHAQATRYWDVNGTALGATNPPGIADGTWSAGNAFWNSEADGGDGGGSGTITGWTAGDHAVFSAGNDVGTIGGLTDGAFITVDTTQVASSILIEEGYVAFRGGRADQGTGTITINTGATLDLDAQARIGQTGGKVVLNGGYLKGTHPASVGSSIIGTGAGPVGLEVNGSGFIGYDDGDGIADNRVMTFGGVITGTGGTTTNGGAGTLIKIGPDQIGIGSSDQDPGAGVVHSQTLFTFAKLEVREGAYRLRNQTVDGTVKETAYGAVPLAELADAITLNGGGIGSNTTVTLHAFRGITVGSNGGYLDHGAGGGLSIPGPITGSGKLTVGSPTSTAVSNPGFTLSNANNENTFTGKLHLLRGTLIVPSAAALGATPGSPVADSITIGGASPALGGTSQLNFTGSSTLGANRGITLAGTTDGRINIATGANTLTYGGAITGPGKLIKMGDGAFSTSGASDYSGGTDVYGKLFVNNTTGSGTGSGAVAVKTASALGTNGTLGGSGTVSGAVTVESGGRIAPGTSAGILTVGSASMLDGSFLDIEIGGTGFPTDFDRLASAGAIAVNGTLNVTLINGYSPANNDSVHIVTAGGGVSGIFDTVNLPVLPGVTWDLDYNANSVALTAMVAAAGLLGDFNEDDKVNAADYVVWRKNETANNPLPNDNGLANQADRFNLWRANFGNPMPGGGGGQGGGAVPEPATAVMLMLGAAILVGRRRGR